MEKIIEKPDSIKVSQNAKGQYSFEVKVYYDEESRSPQEIAGVIETIYNDLHERFKN